jgi:hypothetical protein
MNVHKQSEKDNVGQKSQENPNDQENKRKYEKSD